MMRLPVAVKWADDIKEIAQQALGLTQAGYPQVTTLNNIIRSCGFVRERMMRAVRVSVKDEGELADLERRSKYHLQQLQERRAAEKKNRRPKD